MASGAPSPSCPQQAEPSAFSRPSPSPSAQIINNFLQVVTIIKKMGLTFPTTLVTFLDVTSQASSAVGTVVRAGAGPHFSGTTEWAAESQVPVTLL